MNILVVDDEGGVLESLQRIFSSMGSPTWNTIYASSGDLALEALSHTDIDLIIADMRMPGMDGATLLTTAALRWPSIARFALSGEVNERHAIRVADGVVHQFLGKPCPPQTLLAAVAEIERLSFGDEVAAIREIVSAVPRLPSLPAVFNALRTALAEPRSHARVISDVVRHDPSLAVKILQLANSSFFFRGAHTTDVRTAVSRLGVSLLSRLVLVEGLATGIVNDRAYAEEVRRFFRASLVAEACVPAIHRDEAALAVLLCPIGRALILSADPEGAALAAQLVVSEGLSLAEAERRTFGTCHAAVGGHLIALWGLPLAVSRAVRLQHRPDAFDPGDDLHAATLLANGIDDPAISLAADWQRHRARMELA